MKFYGKKKSIVWDEKRNKPLCQISSDGSVTTKDEYVIGRMRELGYMGDYTEPTAGFEETPDIGELVTDVETMGVREMKALCKKTGLKNYSNLKKEELRELLHDWIKGE